MINDFDTIVKKSYAFNQKEYENSPEWEELRLLYALNYKHVISKEPIIPKKIHQIWLGGPLPDKYLAYTETWIRFHPDWMYYLWTDSNIHLINITKRNIFNQCSNLGMKSDILRYEILNQYGGLYVDTDFECLKSFDDLLYLNFFTGVGYDTVMQLYIGLIACTPNHPIIRNCIQNLNTTYTGSKGSIICNETGANFFTKQFMKRVRSDSHKVVAFPTDFFYPYPNNIRGEGNPYDYVKKNSYAIHHWAVSWSNKRRK